MTALIKNYKVNLFIPCERHFKLYTLICTTTRYCVQQKARRIICYFTYRYYK